MTTPILLYWFVVLTVGVLYLVAVVVVIGLRVLPEKLDAIKATATMTNNQLGQLLVAVRESSAKVNQALEQLTASHLRTEDGADELRESNVMAVQALLDVRDSLREIGAPPI